VLLKPLSRNPLELGASLNNHFSNLGEKNVTFFFSKKLLNNYKDLVSNLIFGFLLKSYTFDKYITKKLYSKNNFFLNLYCFKEFKKLKNKLILLKSINFCKDLISEPANILNPISYSEKCLELKKIGLKVKILDKIQLQKIGMHSLLGVSQGSVNEPRVVIFEWNTNKYTKPTILVGKGVTFDSGGISLKPSLGMEEMITDMGGSAVVVGSMMNAALNKSPKSLVGIIGLVENMPDANSQRPGDIVNSLSGQTIEVINTDAEGRLVLADILTYIQTKFKPKQIIDFATLTGAIVIALGTHRAGLFSNNNSLSKKLEISGEVTGEKLWRLPLGSEYDDEINSSRADIRNIGISRFGGSIQAAQFIQRFIEKKIPWAHLDIAGVSWIKKTGKYSFTKLHSPGATAFGVRLIDQFLKGK
jgi:leucyl aminopeptidase